MPTTTDARRLLISLVGKSIPTVSRGLPNAVIGIDDVNVQVGTTKSPHGEMVPIEWVQKGIDLLLTAGEVEVNVATLGHRSSFIGAVLLTLPGTTVVGASPPRIRLSNHLYWESSKAPEWTSNQSGGVVLDSTELGAPYRKASEDPSTAGQQPFSVDPARLERGLIGHARTQNALARVLTEAGLKPRSPVSSEPSFDLAWQTEETTFVAEVKSITDDNEEIQLRLGLGQVLRYRQSLRQLRGGSVVAVLVPERPPRNSSSWAELCDELNVVLLLNLELAPELRGDAS